MAENKINKPEQEEEKKKKGLAVWWKGLNKGVRTTICILGGAAVATAVVVPTVIAAKGCAGKRVPQIDSSITNVTCTYKLVDGNMEITLACSDATKEIADIESITIGNTILVKGTDYTYDASSQKIVIKKATLEKDSGTIIVKPTVKLKERVPQIDPSVTVVTCTHKLVNENMVITLTCTDGTQEVIGLDSIKIGNISLIKDTDYTYDQLNAIITINKTALDKDSGTIIVKPTLQAKTIDQYYNYEVISGTTNCIIKVKSGAPQFSTPLNIPSTVKINGVECTITQMDDFLNGTYPTDAVVNLPSTMKKICGSCFEFGATTANIKEIVLNDGLEELGQSCFDFGVNSALAEINIPSTLNYTKFIGTYDLFDYTPNLTTIVLDHQDFVNSLDNCKGLFKNATKIFIKNGLNDPTSGKYIFDNFNKQGMSTRGSYSQWQKK